ncbi:class I SAM-dependent methyltransferase [Paenibacillus hamazuiensis]|uniref:class I SAM-dependent methyltransferase n=1 Tax=Paenibacillus hamazuiensis TaxID=2936508 RepID=UPI00200F1758
MVFKLLAKHLRQPSGFIGKMVGRMMNRGNDAMYRYTLGLLDVQPGESILEIGFGNGKYIAELAPHVKDGLVAGIDYSETMVQEAIKSNRTFIEEGTVDIQLASVEQIPYAKLAFDKVFTVNTIYFWPDVRAGIVEIWRVLKPGGKLFVAIRSKENMEKFRFTKYDFTLYDADEVARLFQQANYEDVQVHTNRKGSLEFHCIVATK